MCTEVSPSMILTRETKRMLIRFKQVHFPLQSWVFQCISHFLLQNISLHFQSFFFYVILWSYVSAPEFCKITFQRGKKRLIWYNLYPTTTRHALDKPFDSVLATRVKFLSIDHYVTESLGTHRTHIYISACSVSENILKLYALASKVLTGRLHYFYGLLFKNKGYQSGGLSQSHHLNVNVKTMYFAEL